MENGGDTTTSDTTTTHTTTTDTARRAAAALVPVLKALADEHRLAILITLTSGPRSVVELTEMLDLGQTAVSHHLKVLREQGLVSVTPIGRSNVYAPCCDSITAPVHLLVDLVAPNATGIPTTSANDERSTT